MDHALNKEQQNMLDVNPHAYREEFWKKLHFS